MKLLIHHVNSELLADPSQGAHSNHMDSVSEGLSEPETKTFYENLPFHGIQSPPNKVCLQNEFKNNLLHVVARYI